MKTLFNFIFIYLFTYSSFSLQAQHRTDVWMLGANCSSVPYPMPAVTFATGNIDTFTITRPSFFFITNTSICDTAGNLLFYTNGVNIFNANHDTLLNSVGFNPGYASSINCNMLNIEQAILIIPFPKSDSLYFVFHESGEEFTYNSVLQQQPFELRYSIIDMNLNGGTGGIPLAKKSIILLNDTLVSGMISACKHGNGRDWWIIVPRFNSNTFYKYLVTHDSIQGPFIQTIGSIISLDFFAQSQFNSIGDKFAFVTVNNVLNIFDFDRCTGLFSNAKLIIVPDVSNSFYTKASGLSFSASGHFLYVTEITKIYQYDMQAADIGASQIQVAEWDSSNNPTATWFLTSQLAPDNKIYIGTYGGTFTLHYIDQPDSPGTACNVVQNSFPLSWGNASVPYFPNYDLGAWVGSPCDTLGLAIPPNPSAPLNITVSPNPANAIANFVYHIPANQNMTLTLYDGYGHVVAKQNLYGTSRNFVLHTGKFANGLYYWSVQNEQVRVSGKLVILH